MTTPVSDRSPGVLMVVRNDSRNLDLMLREEVFVMQEMILAAGLELQTATVNDAELTGETESLKPDLAFDSIDVERYDAVMLPCMAPVPGVTMPDKVVKLLQDVLAVGLPVAAMRGSVREIARAGGLRGRNYCYAGRPDLNEQPEFEGAHYIGTGVTTDGNIVTSGICPLAARALGEEDATANLTAAFLEVVRTQQESSES